MNIICIIQARMGSSRLPEKSLTDICGKPMLWYVVNRASLSKMINKVIVATSNSHKDDIIEKFCKENNIDCYRGSENDVLDRYYNTAVKYKGDIIVRVTADCPFVDACIIDELINKLVKENLDYVSNNLIPSFPHGLDAEVFTFNALKKAYLNAKEPFEREHVTTYIRSKDFKKGNLKYDYDLSYIRIVVDYPEDLELIRKIYEKIPEEKRITISWKDIILIFLSSNLREINKMHIGKSQPKAI